MEIKRSIEKIPGGIMIVPLFLGALLNTFAPGTGKYLGSFTNGLITGALPILAVWFFCMGASISLKATPTVLRKGGVLVATKILTAATVGLIASHFIAPNGIQSGFLAGISVLAIVAAMNDTNGGLYMALMQQYGNPEEAGAFALMSLESGPFMTMLTLGLTGLGAFPWQTLLGALIPFVAGFALGNLDKECRKFFSAAVPVMVPFFAFALGNTLNFSVILHTGLLGICMGLFVIAVTGGVLILADIKLGGGTGTAGVAAASTAGAAVTVPQIVASIDPQFAPVAAAATALIATSVVVTAILTPILTAAWAKHHPYLLKRREASLASATEGAAEAIKA